VDETDATIAYLIFNEFVDAKRDINNSPGFSVCDFRRVPKTLTDAFPDEEFDSSDSRSYMINISNFPLNSISLVQQAHGSCGQICALLAVIETVLALPHPVIENLPAFEN
jgi:hypothetical protein